MDDEWAKEITEEEAEPARWFRAGATLIVPTSYSTGHRLSTPVLCGASSDLE